MADERIVDDIYTAICRLLEKRIPRPIPASEISTGLSFFDPALEFGSVELVEFILDCETTFGIPFPSHLMEDSRFSIADLVEYITTNSDKRSNPGL